MRVVEANTRLMKQMFHDGASTSVTLKPALNLHGHLLLVAF
jgi:hypothetical protein